MGPSQSSGWESCGLHAKRDGAGCPVRRINGEFCNSVTVSLSVDWIIDGWVLNVGGEDRRFLIGSVWIHELELD